MRPTLIEAARKPQVFIFNKFQVKKLLGEHEGMPSE